MGSAIEIVTDKCRDCERADIREASLMDETVGPAELNDGDYGGITNGPPNGSLRKSSL